MKLRRLAACLVGALVLVASGNVHVFGEEVGSAPGTAGITNGFVPDLTGTWDVEGETYEYDPPTEVAKYETFSLVLVITEQTGAVFTGYNFHPEDPLDRDYFNGAVVRRSVQLGYSSSVVTGTLVDGPKIVGTSSWWGEDENDIYGTVAFVARKR